MSQRGTVDGVEMIDCVMHRIEHVAPDPDFSVGANIAYNLGRLFDVPGEQFAGSHFLALAKGALVHDPEFVVRHEKGSRVKEIVRAVHFVAPIIENFGFAEATGDAVFVNDDGMEIADAQARTVFDSSIGRQFDGGRFMVCLPWVEERVFNGQIIAAFLEKRAIFGTDSHWAPGTTQDIDEADFLHFQIVPPEFARFARPRAEIEPAFVVVEAIEDDMILLPVLSFIDVESLEADGVFSIGGEDFYLSVGGSQVFSFDPNGDEILAMGCSLSGWESRQWLASFLPMSCIRSEVLPPWATIWSAKVVISSSSCSVQPMK